jgi:hypothetical protein
MKRNLKFKSAPYKACSASARNIMSFEQQGFMSIFSEPGGSRKSAVAGAYHNHVIIRHELSSL